MTIKRKYGNKKLIVDGIKFDSKLEYHCYQMLNKFDVKFSFQERFTLQEGFRYNGKAIRAITMIVDFVIQHKGKTIYLDTKGFATEQSKLKYKMLKYQLREAENSDVVWLHTKKEVNDYIINLILNENVD